MKAQTKGNWNFSLNKIKPANLSDPFGYSKESTLEARSQPAGNKKALLEKKLMDVASSGKMQVVMTLFMMWMIGNNISLIMMLMIGQGLYSTIKAILDVNKTFEIYKNQGIGLLKYKLIYLGIYAIVLGITANKLMTVGLLPTSPADWIDLIPAYSQKNVVIRGN